MSLANSASAADAATSTAGTDISSSKQGTAAGSAMGPTAFVHIDSKDDVDLEMSDPAASHGGWVYVCSSPCDKQLPLDAAFRVSGGDIQTSSSVRLMAKANESVTLRVRGGTRGGAATGLAFTIFGVGALTTAGVSLVMGATSAPNNEGTPYLVAVCAGALGAVFTAAGTAMYAFNASTSVKSLRLEPRQGLSDQYKREAVWAANLRTTSTPTATVFGFQF